MKISILILFLFSLSSFSEDIDDVRWQKVVDNFDGLNNTLRTIFNSEKDCTVLSKDSDINDCKFASFCKIFQKNAGQPYIYVNESGGKIPNYPLANLEKDIANCFYASKESFERNKSSNQLMSTQNNFSSIYQKQRQAKVDLFQAIQDEKCQNDFIKFEQAVAQIELEELSQEQEKEIEDNTFIPPTKKSLEDKFDNISKKAGVKLPDSVKEKFITSSNEYTMVDLNLGGLAGTDGSSTPAKKPIPNQNPFLVSTILTNSEAAGSKEQLKKHHKTVDQAIDRAEKLFKESQESIIEVLNKKIKNNPKDKALIEKMKKRIKTIRFSTFELNPGIEGATCTAPNAYYSPNDHSFSLCPQILELPESALLTIITHELGHSIDPCNLAHTFHKIKSGNTPPPKITKKEQAQIDLGIAENEKRGYFSYFAKDFKPEELKDDEFYLVDQMGMTLKDLSHFMPKFSKKDLDSGIPLSKNPFSGVLDCLSGENSLGARKSAKTKAMADLDKSIGFAKMTGVPDSDPGLQKLLNAKKNFEKVYDQVGACSFLPGQSQMQEAWSDWMAGEVIAKKVKNEKPENKLSMAFESFGFFLAANCNLRKPKVFEDGKKFLRDLNCIDDENENSLSSTIEAIGQASSERSDVHNHSVERIEKLFLAHPELREALGCQQKKSKRIHCE